LSGHSRDGARHASDKVDDARECAGMKKDHAWSWCSPKVDQAREKAEETRQRASESVEWGREKVQGAADEL
jgi:hypothetical protein